MSKFCDAAAAAALRAVLASGARLGDDWSVSFEGWRDTVWG